MSHCENSGPPHPPSISIGKSTLNFSLCLGSLNSQSGPFLEPDRVKQYLVIRHSTSKSPCLRTQHSEWSLQFKLRTSIYCSSLFFHGTRQHKGQSFHCYFILHCATTFGWISSQYCAVIKDTHSHAFTSTAGQHQDPRPSFLPFHPISWELMPQSFPLFMKSLD